MLCWNEKDQLFKELIVLKDQHKTTRTELEHLRESRKIESDLRKILVQANHKKDLIKSKCSSSEGTPSDPKTYTEIQMEFGARKVIKWIINLYIYYHTYAKVFDLIFCQKLKQIHKQFYDY